MGYFARFYKRGRNGCASSSEELVEIKKQARGFVELIVFKRLWSVMLFL